MDTSITIDDTFEMALKVATHICKNDQLTPLPYTELSALSELSGDWGSSIEGIKDTEQRLSSEDPTTRLLAKNEIYMRCATVLSNAADLKIKSEPGDFTSTFKANLQVVANAIVNSMIRIEFCGAYKDFEVGLISTFNFFLKQQKTAEDFAQWPILNKEERKALLISLCHILVEAAQNEADLNFEIPKIIEFTTLPEGTSGTSKSYSSHIEIDDALLDENNPDNAIITICHETLHNSIDRFIYEMSPDIFPGVAEIIYNSKNLMRKYPDVFEYWLYEYAPDEKNGFDKTLTEELIKDIGLKTDHLYTWGRIFVPIVETAYLCPLLPR